MGRTGLVRAHPGAHPLRRADFNLSEAWVDASSGGTTGPLYSTRPGVSTLGRTDPPRNGHARLAAGAKRPVSRRRSSPTRIRAGEDDAAGASRTEAPGAGGRPRDRERMSRSSRPASSTRSARTASAARVHPTALLCCAGRARRTTPLKDYRYGRIRATRSRRSSRRRGSSRPSHSRSSSPGGPGSAPRQCPQRGTTRPARASRARRWLTS